MKSPGACFGVNIFPLCTHFNLSVQQFLPQMISSDLVKPHNALLYFSRYGATAEFILPPAGLAVNGH